MPDNYPPLRKLVAVIVLVAVVALWAYGRLTGNLAGQAMGTLWEVVMLAIVIAAGYTVFGPDTMGQAVDDAQELANQGDQSDDTDDA